MNPYGMFIGNGFPIAPGFNPGMGMRSGLGLMQGLRGKTGLLKSVNWGSLFNNASKALGVVNQTIPLVKQAGPMVSNMKSMLKLASVFKDETDVGVSNTSNATTNNHIKKEVNNDADNSFNNNISSNSPNFFL